MATLAPLSQTILLTEDGSVIPVTVQVPIPVAGVVTPTYPVITTPAAINSDPTPQVGETLIGIDPVGNGPVVARRWIAGGTTVATTQAYAPTAAGSLRYEADLQGPDGTILTSGSDIVVQAAPVSPTIANTNGDSSLFATQIDGAQAALAPAVQIATDMGYL